MRSDEKINVAAPGPRGCFSATRTLSSRQMQHCCVATSREGVGDSTAIALHSGRGSCYCSRRGAAALGPREGTDGTVTFTRTCKCLFSRSETHCLVDGDHPARWQAPVRAEHVGTGRRSCGCPTTPSPHAYLQVARLAQIVIRVVYVGLVRTYSVYVHSVRYPPLVGRCSRRCSGVLAVAPPGALAPVLAQDRFGRTDSWALLASVLSARSYL